jgi:hypothetical protein
MVYIRKYSGPLQKGKRSAYVKGTRTQARRPTYKKRSSAVKKKYTTFNRQMVRWNSQNSEKKIVPYKNFTNGVGVNFLIEIPGEALPNVGLTNDNTSCLVLQTGDELTDANTNLNQATGMPTCTAIGGYNFPPYAYNDTSTTPPTTEINKNGATGKYINITSSMINLNINMDPLIDSGDGNDVADAIMPHQFRIIQVKAKRSNSVASGIGQVAEREPDLASNLFINESGVDAGLATDMAAQDPFTWFVNKKKWMCLKDERFTLSNYANFFANNSTISWPVSGVTKHPSQRFKKYYFPKPKGR